MEIIATTKLQKLAKSYKLSPEQLAFADLLSLGWEEEDAWAIAMRIGTTWTKKALKEEIDKLKENEGTQRRIEENKKTLKKAEIKKIKSKMDAQAEAILERATNKEMKLIELQTILEDLKPGSPEYNKINDQIFTITQMKKDEVKTDEKTIHYFLPVNYPTGCQDCLYEKCNSCKFKKAYKEGEE